MNPSENNKSPTDPTETMVWSGFCFWRKKHMQENLTERFTKKIGIKYY